MKRIITVMQIVLFLQATAAFAGNGRTIHKYDTNYADTFLDYSTLSDCIHDDISASGIFDSCFNKIAIRTPYPGYSFNVLKRPLYAQLIIPGKSIHNLLPG